MYKYSFIFLFIFSISSFAQNAECDSVRLSISNYYGGDIQWQYSDDSLTWNDINNATDSLLLIPGNEQVYYRAKITEGTCDSYYSDPAFDVIPFALSEDEIDFITSGTTDEMMDVMNIFEQPDSMVLRSQCAPLSIECNLAEIEHLKERMYKTVTNPDHTGVGIAAPQVGVKRKASWVQRYDKAPWWNPMSAPYEFYINLEIIAYSDTVQSRSDGCLSVPQDGNYPDVVDYSYRAIWVDVRYQLLDGTIVTERIDDEYTAHIFQHEADHLSGIMYMDRAVEENPGRFTIIEFNPPKNYKIPRM